jgi:hypothetical protein
MEWIALLPGLGLVWVAGIALLLLLPVRRGESHAATSLPWLLGCGWFVGAFVLTLWMRVLSLAGVPFGIVAIGAPMLAVAGAALWWARRRTASTDGAWSLRAVIAALAGGDLRGWQRALWLALLAWLALRFALLLGEIWWRPLYPWDAWTQWGTKARVWFELKTMTPFVPLNDWLQPGSAAYIDAAPHYPATVPLLQVWSAVLLGSWNDAWVNFPWWLAGVALALALYGFLTQRGVSPPGALVATWMVSSLPILNAHVALAGYADLWMAAFLTLGVLAALQWSATRQWRDAALAILLLAACVLTKNPGKAWLIVLLPGALAAVLPRHGLQVAGAGIALAMVALLLLAQTNPTILGYQLHLDFVAPWRGLSEAYFAYANWHLLWYGAIAVAILGRRQMFQPDLAPLTIIVGSGLIFLFFGFAFTNAARWVADQSTVNRATLHLAPLVAIWMVLVFNRWLREQNASMASRETIEAPAAT